MTARACLVALSLAAPLCAQVTPFGSGCDLRTGFPPSLFVSPAPAFGVDVRAAMLTAPPSTPAVLIVGASNSAWGTTPLPFDLTPLGMPGCALLVAPDVAVPFGANGTVLLPTSGMPGVTVFLQGLATDATARPSGLSAGLRLDVPDPLGPFTIAMMPDTQFYSQHGHLHFHFLGQTNWVAQNRARVAFAVQVGDIVQSGASDPAQWVRADAAIQVLDGVLPHTVALGNHDFDTVSSKASAQEFVRWFGPSRYAGRSWYGGSTPDGQNSYQVFTGGREAFLHLALEWRASDDALAWAQEVLARHPDLPAIVSTHEHLGIGDPAPWRTGGRTPDGTGNNGAEDVHRKLVEPFDQVFLVMCGHVHGTGRRTDTTPLGRTVHSMLADYQSDPNGGNGYFRTLEVSPRAATIAVRAISPTWVTGSGPSYDNDPAHNYDLVYDTIAHRAELRATRVIRLREGQDLGHGPYLGTQDTHVGDGGGGGTLPGQSKGTDPDVWCDGNQDHNQGLLRFDGLIGTGPGQIPPGTSIRRAILTLTTEGTNANSVNGGKLYRMTRSWSEASTWNSLGAGIQVGVETAPSHDADSAGQVDAKSTRSFDVTASVQAWSNGTPNLGWAIVANGTDGWSFRSSEWTAVAERPLLTVTY